MGAEDFPFNIRKSLIFHAARENVKTEKWNVEKSRDEWKFSWENAQQEHESSEKKKLNLGKNLVSCENF